METKYTAIENLDQQLVSTSKKDDKARGLRVCAEIKDKDCKYCGKKFRENFELEVHLKSHSETKSYTSVQCDKTVVLELRQMQLIKGHKS